MKTPGFDDESLMELFRQVYKGKELPEVEKAWRVRLMTRIREMGPPDRRPLFLPSFERLVWRLAPVTALLAIVLSALLINLGLDSAYDAVQLLTRAVEELTLAQLFAA